MRRIFLIVIDSFGIGAMPDAADFGDEGADTFGHIDDHMPEFVIPNLASLGLTQLHPAKHVSARRTQGVYMRLLEAGCGKDTMTGHWEMMGIRTTEPFLTFTDTGFPDELVEELSQLTGHPVLGNKAASGTVILDELGEQAIRENALIVYTSADSVLQIAASEEVCGLDELYRCCEIARQITMKPGWKVGRVIARPFVGNHAGAFTRTANRHDYALPPSGPTVMDGLKEAGFDVISIGKIYDIFSGKGITEAIHSSSSVQGMLQTIEMTGRDFHGLCFVNLVDFDALWGHRRNPVGYGEEMECFDVLLGDLMQRLGEEDLLMVTADHGNDPTYKGTDHTREMVPLLIWSPGMKDGRQLADRTTFADIGATIAENFRIAMPEGCIGEKIVF